jgi:hypothetical protein
MGANIDRSKASQCGGKKRHDTRQDALDHLARLIRLGAPAWRISVYRCRHCTAWHVGHHPRSQRGRT